MKKSFVLITRSYKYGGYCVAGFDLETKGWIHLVSSAEPTGSEIPKPFFEPFDDLDILEVETKGKVPCGCQTENFLLDLSVPPRKAGKFSFYELLSPAYVLSTPFLLGNGSSGLSEEEIKRQHTSLGLYAVENLLFDFYLGDDGKKHYRCKFRYMGRGYSEISVIDPIYRKDGFQGQTIAHALLAVSLPAVPYQTGKYYKFIAKIFPLTAEEATRLKAVVPSNFAPHSRIFAKDYPDSSKESALRAVHFLQSLSEGRDPDTNAVLDSTMIFSPSYAAWLRYCAEKLEGTAKRIEEKQFGQMPTCILRKNIERIPVSDEPASASEIARRITELCEPYGKKLTAVMVGNFFLQAGMLKEEGELHKRKVPTELGMEYGITTEYRNNAAGIRFFIVLYGRAAQRFFVDNLEHCVKVLESPRG